MTKKEEAKLEMLDAAVSILESGNGTLSTVPALVEKTKVLREVVEKIRSKEELFKSAALGKAGSKNLTKHEILEKAIVAASALFSYGLDNNDAEASATGDLSDSDFSRMREEAVITSIKNIMTKAAELGNKLENYGITQQFLDELQTGVNDFYKKLSQKSTGFAIKKTAKSTIEELFELADKEIKSTDRLMKRYRGTEAELYGNYLSARIIKDKATVKRNAR